MDTLDANLALGFGRYERILHWSTDIKGSGVKTLGSLTNNPDKVYQLSDFGMKISERVPLKWKRQLMMDFILTLRR